MLTICWYLVSGFLLRKLTPTFGKMIAVEQQLTGEYRSCQSDIVNFSEEIAFLKGNNFEKKKLNEAFNNLISQNEYILEKRLFMNSFDGILIKYGSVIGGNIVVGLPVFGHNRLKYLKSIGKDTGKMTRDYVRNSSLLIDLGSAIGRYKNLK